MTATGEPEVTAKPKPKPEPEPDDARDDDDDDDDVINKVFLNLVCLSEFRLSITMTDSETAERSKADDKSPHALMACADSTRTTAPC